MLDVAAAAATISFGAGLSGEGELLVSKLAFKEVGGDVPVIAGPHHPRQPQNLDFSQASSPGRPPGTAALAAGDASRASFLPASDSRDPR